MVTTALRVLPLANNQFLFNLPSRKEAGRVKFGDWFWNGRKLFLDWWSLFSGTKPTEQIQGQRWIRAFGIPLHDWSEKILRFVGDQYGGYIDSDEDTKKRNNLLWARICANYSDHEPKSKLDLIVGDLVFEISIIADSHSKLAIVGKAAKCQLNDHRSCDLWSKEKNALTPTLSHVLNSKPNSRVGPSHNQAQQEVKQLLKQANPNLLDHNYYSKGKIGKRPNGLFRGKGKKEWIVIEAAQSLKSLKGSYMVSHKGTKTKIDKSPSQSSYQPSIVKFLEKNCNLGYEVSSEEQIDSDDEAEHMQSFPLLSLPSTYPDLSMVSLRDFDISSPSGCDIFSLPRYEENLHAQQVINAPMVIETSYWTKVAMTKGCKAFGVNSVGFEREIFDMILRIEQKRQSQIQLQKGRTSEGKKPKNKGERETGLLECTLTY
ncbi:uncharacterized protein [Nicotiana tomentosiformis]|uniref:uncharacterized protein n=1 Tax=Nicotiana tomentosiformis TaxID=4098 RepID=UPI0008784545